MMSSDTIAKQKKTLYLANPYGFSTQQKTGPLEDLVLALSSLGGVVWEPFERNNQENKPPGGRVILLR